MSLQGKYNAQNDLVDIYKTLTRRMLRTVCNKEGVSWPNSVSAFWNALASVCTVYEVYSSSIPNIHLTYSQLQSLSKVWCENMQSHYFSKMYIKNNLAKELVLKLVFTLTIGRGGK